MELDKPSASIFTKHPVYHTTLPTHLDKLKLGVILCIPLFKTNRQFDDHIYIDDYTTFDKRYNDTFNRAIKDSDHIFKHQISVDGGEKEDHICVYITGKLDVIIGDYLGDMKLLMEPLSDYSISHLTSIGFSLLFDSATPRLISRHGVDMCVDVYVEIDAEYSTMFHQIISDTLYFSATIHPSSNNNRTHCISFDLAHPPSIDQLIRLRELIKISSINIKLTSVIFDYTSNALRDAVIDLSRRVYIATNMEQHR